MLHFTVGNTAQTFVVTLNEKKTLSNPYYLFVFEHVTTKTVYKFVLNSASDLSAYPTRFNKFEISVPARFSNAMQGDYIYDIYEQASSTNTDISLTGAKVETGRMKLDDNTAFEYEKYDGAQTYKTYAG